MSEDKSKQHQHDFDGIEELDNALPGWWLGIFWVSVALAVFYVPYYHFIRPDKLPRASYEAAVAAIEEQRSQQAAARAVETERAGGGLMARYEAGAWREDAQKTWTTFCLACHAADGGGGIGPNFTDDYYIHGGKIEDFIRVINEGVPEKGMVSWKALLKPEQIENVSFFIRDLRGKPAAQPKDPEGRKVDEDGAFIEDAEPAEGE